MIEVNCFLYNSKFAEMGVDTEDTMAKMCFTKEEVSSIRERVEDDETEICKKTCLVYFKNGEGLVVDEPYSKMKKLIYYK